MAEEIAAALPEVPAAEAEHAFADLLSRLPGRHAELLRLVYVDGFRLTELATATGRSVTALTTALARARAAFAEMYNAIDRSR